MERDKRLTSTLVIGVIAVALVAAFLILSNKEADNTAAEDATPPPADLFPEEAITTVTHIRVTDHSNGNVLEATLSAEGSEWVINDAPEGSDVGLGVDYATISQAVTPLTTLRPTRTLNEIESMATYGLDQAAYTIEFDTSGGGSHTLEVGDQNPGGSSYYITADGSPDVSLVSSFSIDPAVNLVKTPPYIQPTATPGPSPTPTETPEGNG
jgi:hypothetical protein